MYSLYIANKNYSSWSLRPWVLMRELGIAFDERQVRFEGASSWSAFRNFSPTGKVPCLIDGKTTVWDSLGITEYLAERHSSVWPAEGEARTWARCAAAEMHSGFGALREQCSMSCGIRMKLREIPATLIKDVARLDELWGEGLARFGGPFLAGKAFTAVDAFYAPVVFRIQTYGLNVEPRSAQYVQHMLQRSSMRRWYDDALAETFRDEAHEVEIRQRGELMADYRDEEA